MNDGKVGYTLHKKIPVSFNVYVIQMRFLMEFDWSSEHQRILIVHAMTNFDGGFLLDADFSCRVRIVRNVVNHPQCDYDDISVSFSRKLTSVAFAGYLSYDWRMPVVVLYAVYGDNRLTASGRNNQYSCLNYIYIYESYNKQNSRMFKVLIERSVSRRQTIMGSTVKHPSSSECPKQPLHIHGNGVVTDDSSNCNLKSQ
jgi:hypothetical protein